MTEAETKSAGRKAWKQNPEAVQRDILRVATEEFATSGYAGARVNVIAERTATSKRMIYYYFNDKEDLYRRVLENAYREIRRGEQALEIDQLSAVEAVKKLISFTFHHHAQNPNFIRLVMIENIHYGRHLVAKDLFEQINAPAIERVRSIYQRGIDEGVFREGLSAVKIHWHISATCFYNVSNRVTFSNAFGGELFEPEGQQALCDEVQQMVLRYLQKDVDA